MKTWIIAKNVLRRIAHDPRTLVLIALTPLLFILLYGYSFTSGHPTHLRLIVVNHDNGLASVRTEAAGRVTLSLSLGDQLVSALDPRTFDVIHETDPAAAQAAVKAGRAWAALVLAKNFSQGMVDSVLSTTGRRVFPYEGRTITVLPPEQTETGFARLDLDDSNPSVSEAILSALKTAFSGLLPQEQNKETPTASPLVVTPLYGGGTVSLLDYTAPGVIGFAMTLITIMLTAISIVRERTTGTLPRILVAPVHSFEVTLGHTLAFALISILQVAELFVVSYLLFHIRFLGSPLVVALIVAVYAIVLQGIATLLSTLARNEFQAMQFILVILIPSIMISGVFWPIEAIPQHIRFLCYASPLTYANLALREVMLRGRGIAGIGLELGALGGLAIVTLGLGIAFLHRQGRSG